LARFCLERFHALAHQSEVVPCVPTDCVKVFFNSELISSATDRAAKRELFHMRMRNAEGTLLRARADGEIVFWFSCEIISLHLSRVTIIAEMNFPPAEPIPHLAAKLTFEFDEICSVFRTLCSESSARATTANQIVWIVTSVVSFAFLATWHSAKVRSFAFSAHEILKLFHSEFA
jgi:hypothetical protein